MDANTYNQFKLNSFVDKSNLFNDCYRSSIIKLFCFKKDTKWQIAHGVIILDSFAVPNENKNIILETEKIIVLEFSLNSIDLTNIISQIKDGVIEIMGEKYYFKDEENHVIIRHWDYRGDEAIKKFGTNAKIYELTYELNTNQQYVEQEHHEFIENLLRTNDIPYDGINDLAKRFFFAGHESTLYNNQNIHIFAPSMLGFNEESRFKEDGLNIQLWADRAIKLTDIKISTIEQTDKFEIKNRIIKVNNEDLTDENGMIVTINKLIPNPDYQIVSAKILLSYRNHHLVTKENYNPFFKTYNYGISILKNIDPDFENYFNALNGNEKEKNFEIAVSNLFGLCGFITLPFDRITKLQDISDLIVIDPHEPRILVVEITLHRITKDKKLDKLLGRFDDIKKLITNVDLIPVIITSEESVNEIDNKQAIEKQISVLNYQDLQNLFEYAKQSEKPGNIIEYIKAKIPMIINR